MSKGRCPAPAVPHDAGSTDYLTPNALLSCSVAVCSLDCVLSAEVRRLLICHVETADDQCTVCIQQLVVVCFMHEQSRDSACARSDVNFMLLLRRSVSIISIIPLRYLRPSEHIGLDNSLQP